MPASLKLTQLCTLRTVTVVVYRLISPALISAGLIESRSALYRAVARPDLLSFPALISAGLIDSVNYISARKPRRISISGTDQSSSLKRYQGPGVENKDSISRHRSVPASLKHFQVHR